MPALVVAMAANPTCSRMRADPASQALGRTKPGPSCRARKAAALSVEAPGITARPCGPALRCARLHRRRSRSLATPSRGPAGVRPVDPHDFAWEEGLRD